MTTEIHYLALTVLMTAILWVPYIINRMREHEHGAFAAVWNPEPDLRPKAKWAERLMRAHSNAVENMVVFAPLVLALHGIGISNEVTVQACVVYFYARLAHVLLYTFRVPLLRTIAFAVGNFCQIILAVMLLQS